MGKSGSADLPLHSGSAPSWLFERMKRLGGAVSEAVVQEYGRKELLERLSNPYWFQALGCVLGFDWHSSGLTTTTMGALKESLDIDRHGVAVAGGKGRTSRKTPAEIESRPINASTAEELKKHSRLSAKIDSACLQDGFTLYHHTIAFTEEGDWCVIQQGKNESHARRYHWLSDNVEKFLQDPHEAVCSDYREQEVLNLSSSGSSETRKVSVDLVNDGPGHLKRYFNGQSSLADFENGVQLSMPDRHLLREKDLEPRSLKQLEKAYELKPSDYRELVEVDGVGKKSLRALGLIAELVYGSGSDWEDPAKYSYAHGGKDGTPFPVDRESYDNSVRVMEKVVKDADIDSREKRKALERLGDFGKGS